jgi:hypothetical protein
MSCPPLDVTVRRDLENGKVVWNLIKLVNSSYDYRF